MILNGFNAGWEHGGINGLTPSEMFLQRLIKSDTHKKRNRKV
jgi:hypothetical protein